MRQIGGFRTGFEGSQDYDLALRYIEQLQAAEIHHIPHVLYHWRALPGSTALSNAEKPYAQIAAARAIEESLCRRKVSARVSIEHAGYAVHYQLPTTPPLVTLIIAAKCDHQHLKRCVTSIGNRTAYPRYELVVVASPGDARLQADLAELAAAQVRIVPLPEGDSLAAAYNAGVAAAKGSVIGLLASNTEVIAPQWLTHMVGLALQPDVGAVGARLVSLDHRIRHAGLVLGLGGIAGHVHKDLPRSHPGHCGRAALLQSVSAVTAACLIVRKDLYMRVGGLDEGDFADSFHDVDLCLKLRELGYRSVWTPQAELDDYGANETSPAGADSDRARTAMLRRWANELRKDPAYNPN